MSPVVSARRWLNEPTPRKQMLPAYLILTIGIMAGVTRFDSLSAQRTDDVREFAQSTALSQCSTRIETRDSLRAVLLGITTLFDQDANSERIVNLIQADYPALDFDIECAKYKETP